MTLIRVWDTDGFHDAMASLALSYDTLHRLMVKAMKELGYAVQTGDKEALRRRLEAGPGPNSPEWEGILSHALADLDLSQLWLMLPDKSPTTFSDEAVRLAFGGKNPLEKDND